MLSQHVVRRRQQMPQRRTSQHEPLTVRIVDLIREIRSPTDDQPIRKRRPRAGDVLCQPRLQSCFIDATDRRTGRALHRAIAL